MPRRTDGKLNIWAASLGSRIIWILVLSILLLCLTVLIAVRAVGVSDLRATRLDDCITSRVMHPNGIVTTYDSNEFEPMMIGDSITLKVHLPEDRRIPYSALCFSAYNTIIKITDDDGRVLYEHGAEMRGIRHKTTGHVLVKASFPNEDWGRELTILMIPLEDHSMSGIYNVYAVEAVKAVWYPLLVDGQMLFIILTLIISLSVLMLIVLLFMMIGGVDTRQGILLSLYSIMLCIWAMGYTTLINLLSDNAYMTSFAEYFALYAAPPLLTAYFSFENLPKLQQRTFRIMTYALTAFFILTVAAEWHGKVSAYTTFLTVLRVCIVLVIVVSVLFMYRRKTRRDLARNVQHYGILVTMFLVLLEMLRVYIWGHDLHRFPFLTRFSRVRLAPFIGISFVASMTISYLIRLVQTMRDTRTREELENMAKRDALTGIPNRYAIDESLAAMAEDGTKQYVMLFFDANDLKFANDSFGHDTGDHLLQLVGRALRESFADRSIFFGRYGGDEFAVCVPTARDAKKGCRHFEQVISDANDAGYMPCRITVAYGLSEHRPGDPRTPEATLKDADARMYIEKIRMKNGTPAR